MYYHQLLQYKIHTSAIGTRSFLGLWTNRRKTCRHKLIPERKKNCKRTHTDELESKRNEVNRTFFKWKESNKQKCFVWRYACTHISRVHFSIFSGAAFRLHTLVSFACLSVYCSCVRVYAKKFIKADYTIPTEFHCNFFYTESDHTLVKLGYYGSFIAK